MVIVGLTGGIGSGKSTVSSMLVERGAVLVDADAIARAIVEPGGAAYDAVIERFGPTVVRSDGHLDRPALAAVVFHDDEARKALNGITFPAIGAEMLRQVAAAGEVEPDAIVIMDIPLLAEGGRERYPLQGVIVVDTPVDIAVSRLVAHRGFTEDDARARVAAQATREQRTAIADRVIDNAGAPAALEHQIDDAWDWMVSLRRPAEG